MWKFEHTLVTEHGTPEQVWQIWSDVENWNRWDPQVEWSKCIGDFAKGSTIELKPIKVPQTSGKITECEPHKTFTITTSVALGTKITFIHTVEPQSPGVKLTHQVSITGPLSPVFEGLIGKQIKQGLPIAMEKLAGLLS